MVVTLALVNYYGPRGCYAGVSIHQSSFLPVQLLAWYSKQGHFVSSVSDHHCFEMRSYGVATHPTSRKILNHLAELSTTRYSNRGHTDPVTVNRVRASSLDESELIRIFHKKIVRPSVCLSVCPSKKFCFFSVLSTQRMDHR